MFYPTDKTYYLFYPRESKHANSSAICLLVSCQKQKKKMVARWPNDATGPFVTSHRHIFQKAGTSKNKSSFAIFREIENIFC